jgi:hypothetical protein
MSLIIPAMKSSVAADYRRFARQEARTKSPLYARLAESVAEDDALLALLEEVPPQRRQPNLLLAVVRYRFGTQPDPVAFRRAVLEHRDEVLALLRTKRTQTNEPGRCAPLLPILAQLRQPLALLEVGASAGLCLLPDRYGYDFDGQRLGSSEPVFPCLPVGPLPIPPRLPRVAWRAGIDLEPVDLNADEAVRWIEALVWPEELDRLRRLRQAVAVARREPPRVVQGDLVEKLAPLAAQAPPDATLVVFHTAVLAYLHPPERERFRQQVLQLPARWIAVEGPGVLPRQAPPAAQAPYAEPHFEISLDGASPIALCDPHGRWLQWLA